MGQPFLQVLYVYKFVSFFPSILQVRQMKPSGVGWPVKDIYLVSGKAKDFDPGSLGPESVLFISHYPAPLKKWIFKSKEHIII